jgi:hypothetical protein
MSPAFHALLQEFAQSRGMTAEESTYGLEFECEGTHVYVIEHPLHEDRLLCEVQLAAFDDMPPAAVLSTLLQINEAARFEHDWVIVMNGDLEVSLSTSIPIAGVRVAQVEDLLIDGVDRGQVLKEMLQALLLTAEGAATDGQPVRTEGEMDPMLMVRG